MLQILNFSELQAKGLKVAKIKANRDLDEKKVKAKMADLKSRGLIIPAMVVNANDALREHLDLCDFRDGTIAVDSTNAERYLVLIDGQHRFEAHLRLMEGCEDYTRDFTFQFVQIEDGVSILDVLKAVNDPGHTWTLSDYTHSAWELNKENPMLSFISELVSDGISYSSAAKWATLNRRLTPSMVKEAVNNEGAIDPLFTNIKYLASGKRLFAVAKKALGKAIVKPRALVDWVIDILSDADSKEAEANQLINFFESLTADQVESLKKAKGQKNGASKEEALRRALDKFYQAFQSKSE